MMELISRTRNGMITYCAHCKVYHLEFGNLFFRLSEAGFECLRNYIVSINGPYCERSNRKMNANRKIFLKLPAQNVYFCVCTAELEELKSRELKIWIFISLKRQYIMPNTIWGYSSNF